VNAAPDTEAARGAASRLRKAMFKLAVATLVIAFLGVLGQRFPQSVYAALFAVLTGIALAVFIGSVLTMFFVSSYVEERRALTEGLSSMWGYLAQASKWGLAGGGLGALMSTVLPSRLSESTDTNSSTLPLAGWLAVLFAGIGVAIGILEEWRTLVATSNPAPAKPGPSLSPNSGGSSGDAEG
jgi:protein-S-isoprenylcysteine O-methyltransferase Ste14